MIKNKFNIIGVMSGTSLDGIDLAHVNLSFNQGKWTYSFKKTDTLPYSSHWEDNLKKADKLSKVEVKTLDEEYTAYLAEKILSFINENNIKNIDAVCSHGHTVFHQPKDKYTLQIGNLPKIADLIQQKVVCNFRIQDVRAGGQGAPLVPIGDKLLFPNYKACINLGGFANISLEQNEKRIAYDICPANTVLNRFAEKLGNPYDEGGKIAQSGKVDQDLIEKLNALEFYKVPPPKSLGIEWVRKHVLPLLEKSGLSVEDILATFTQHVALQLASSIAQFDKGKVLITGGGAFNDYLIKGLREQTNCSIVVPDKTLIDFKEALIFGFLGVLRLRNEINVLQSVTGSSNDHSAGFIYSPTTS